MRIVEVLLANTRERPILIVCYTNHALDQFLEGILKFCNNDNELVRIGGKSQCETLQKYNLATIKSDMKKNRQVPTFIHRGRAESHYQLKVIQDDITALEKQIDYISDTVLGDELFPVITRLNRDHYAQLNKLANGRLNLNEVILNWLGYRIRTDTDRQRSNVFNGLNMDDFDEAMLIDEEPEMDEEFVRALEEERFIDGESSDDADSDIFDIDYDLSKRLKTFFGPTKPINFNDIVPMNHVEDADGFQQVQKKGKSFKQQINKEIRKSQTMSEEQAAAVADITKLLPDNRWNLYRLWVKLYAQIYENQIKAKREEYQIECLRFNGLRKEEDIEIVKKAKIIGMTTTGAAKYRHIIDGTKPTITSKETFFLFKFTNYQTQQMLINFLQSTHVQLSKKRPKCLRPTL